MGAQPVLREHSAPGRHSVSDFSSHVFGYLQRVDQRRWADTYLRGLLSTPGRKTVRHMARTLALPASAPQALQQFVTASPWNWETAQRELARLAVSALSSPVVDDRHGSPGEARPSLGGGQAAHGPAFRAPGQLPDRDRSLPDG